VVARKLAPEESRPHGQHARRHSFIARYDSMPAADPIRALADLVVILGLASQRIEAPGAAAGCGEIKGYEAEQHGGLAAIGQRIEAFRGMANEISEGQLTREDEGGDARKQLKEKARRR
jgi:hypothetical protein